MKNSIIYGLGILTIIVLALAFKKPAIRLLGGYTEQKTEIEIDTVVLPSIIDTLEVFNSYVKTKGIILNPKPIIKYVYADKYKEEVIDSTKIFNVSVIDSLINGKFKVTNDFRGNLIDADFTYRPLFPKYIKETKPIIVTKTITETVYNSNNLFGLGVGINSELTPSLNIDYITTKNFGYSIDVSKPDLIDKNYPIKDLIIGFKLTKYW